MKLLRTVFFYVGKVCCIRGGEEQRNLKPSQFKRYTNPHHYMYIENGSKNNSGTSLRVINKNVPIYACEKSGERCLVYLLDLYLSKLPPSALEKDIFYIRPKATRPEGNSPWYCNQPVGGDKLQTMVKDMCSDAGIEERKTNHSLRATGATSMFSANVPEKIIQSRTGHRSVEALRLYKRPTVDQQRSVTQLLNYIWKC